ncbi:MAG: fibronectin type III domain-containing protein, partial [Oscillospiraceae bacterium]|nr:fibronectin type III domain-containing protein [Oscillospiraceae bacterium]
MTIEWKKTKRALAILLAMVMLLGQAELILPHASAAGIEDEAQQSGEPDQAPSEDADGGVGAPETTDTPMRGGGDPGGDRTGTLSIPLNPGPDGGQWTQFELADREFTLTIPEEGFAAGSYALGFALLTESSSDMYVSFNYRVTDGSGEEAAYDQVALNVWEMNEGENGVWSMNWPNAYFSAAEPGEFTVVLSQSGAYIGYDNGESTDSIELAVAAWKAVEPPEFGHEEESFTEPFALTFTNIPEGADVYYLIGKGPASGSPYTLYDPADPPVIRGECSIIAYAQVETDSGAVTSPMIRTWYMPEAEVTQPNCDSEWGIMESGSSVILSADDGSTIYYILDSRRTDYNFIDMLEYGRVYTGPITVTGEIGDTVYLSFMSMNADGLCSYMETREFEIGTPPPRVPVFSPDPDWSDGYYTPVELDGAAAVTITGEPGTVLYYVLNDKYASPQESGLSTDSNTLTLTVDHDMFINVQAYDPVKDMFSDNRSAGYGKNCSARAYAVSAPKTLTVTQSARVSESGMIFSGHDEVFAVNVAQAGTYQFNITYPDKYYYSSYPVSLYDAEGEDAGVFEDVSDWGNGTAYRCTAELAEGTYLLEILRDQGTSYGYDAQKYELSITKGLAAPTISPDPETEYTDEVEVSITAPEEGCTIYYRTSYYGSETEYTGPFFVSGYKDIYARAEKDGVSSGESSAYFRAPVSAPEIEPSDGWFSAVTQMTVTHPNDKAALYYRIDYGEENLYTGPVAVSSTCTIDAWAELNGEQSSRTYVSFNVDADAPYTYGYGSRFVYDTGNYSGGVYSDTVMAGTVSVTVKNIYDSNSGMDHADIYLWQEGTGFTLLGSVDWADYSSSEPFIWNTAATVPLSASGPVSVRLAAIGYDKVGNPSVDPSELAEDYDISDAPVFTVDNTPAVPVSGFTAEADVGRINLSWQREKETVYYDSFIIYRAESIEALAENVLEESSYYNTSHRDVFLNSESAAGTYYYGIVVKEGRGTNSEMVIAGPVAALPDVNAPEIHMWYLSDGDVINGTSNIEIQLEDETSLKKIEAVITASDGTEYVPGNSPWLYGQEYATDYTWDYIYRNEIAALPDGEYTLTVTAEDVFGNVSTLTRSFTKDAVPPAAPTGISTSPLPGKIRIGWTASADPDIKQYNILYSESEDGQYYLAGSTQELYYNYPSYSYLTPGAEYWFKVRSEDMGGNTGESAPVKGTVGKYNPQLRLVSEPRVGDGLEVEFKGFRDDEYVLFFLDREENYRTYARMDDGEVAKTANISVDNIRGTHTLRAVGESSGVTAVMRFTIGDLSPTLTIADNEIPRGGSFTASVDDFPGGKNVYLHLDPAESDDSGYNCIYYYPDGDNSGTFYLSSFGDPAPGSYTLRAVEPDTGLTAFAELVVTSAEPSLRCDKELPKPGDYVSFYAGGFSTAETKFFINGEEKGTGSYRGSTGEQYISLTFPTFPNDVGAVLVRAVQPSTGKSASMRLMLGHTVPELSLSAESTGVEESFTVNGSGFSNEYVELYVDGVYVKNAWSASSVSLSHSFGYDTAPGLHGIELKGRSSNCSAVGTVTLEDRVQALSSYPENPVPEAALTLTATGFRASENVEFRMNGTRLGSARAGADGVAVFTIDRLTEAPENGYVFSARGEVSGRTALCGTQSALSLNYSGNARWGEALNVTVTGLAAGETAEVYWNNRTGLPVTADASGTASVSIAVPAGMTGSMDITVVGLTGFKRGYASVPVAAYSPTMTASPAAVVLGETVDVRLSGSRDGAELRLVVDGMLTDTVLEDGRCSYTVPANGAVGAHVLEVFDPECGIVGSRSITASAPAFNLTYPASLEPGESFELGAVGFEDAVITFDGLLPGDNGRFTLADNALPGEHTARFAVDRYALAETAVITVTAPSPTVGALLNEGGNTVAISAEGFLPGEQIRFWFDSREITGSLSAHAAGEDGGISVTYALPADTVAGVHPLTAVGSRSFRMASDTVEIEEIGPVLSIRESPAEGRPGDRLHFEGANFTPDGAYEIGFEGEIIVSGLTADGSGEISGEFELPAGYADGWYQIVASDMLSEGSAVAFVRLDRTAPAAPRLSLSAKKQSLILSWEPPADDDIAYYEVFCGNEKLARLTGVTSLELNMRSESFPLIPGQSRSFTVKATDRLGNEGAASAAVTGGLASGSDAPELSSVYVSYSNYIRMGGETLPILSGGSERVWISASDDQDIRSFVTEIAPEGGAFTELANSLPNYYGTYSGLAHFDSSFDMDTTAFADGVYTVRATATDSNGLTASREQRYYIDNTAPAPVTGLSVREISNALTVSWSWTPGANGEIADRFMVRYSEDADFETGNSQTVYYSSGEKSVTLRRLTPGAVYYIRVTAMDLAGNESAPAAGSGTPVLDNESPVITAVYPGEGKLGADVAFRIAAEDNAELDATSVRAEINAGSSGSFIPFGSYYYSNTLRSNEHDLNGSYTLRFYISDLSGNESAPFEMTREFDTFVSPAVGLQAGPAAGGIRLSWNKSPDKDLIYYYVYRAAAGEDYRYLTALSPLKVTNGETAVWTDYDVDDGVVYSYKIVAVDDVYNESSRDDAAAASAERGNFSTSIAVTPGENAVPGSLLHIEGSGYRAGESVTAYIDGDEYIFWVYADNEGNVSADWSYVRATEAGEHVIRLRGDWSAAEASAAFVCLPVKLTAPAAPETASGAMEIRLSWGGVSGAGWYRVYRAGEGEELSLLADKVYGTGYTDRAVSMTGGVGNIYTYAIAAVDRYGNEGVLSESSVDRPQPDTVDPEITAFTFQRVGSELRLIAEAGDDLRLGSVIFRYKPAEAGDEGYITIAEIPAAAGSAKATLNTSLDTTGLTDGSYTLLAQAVDGAGRVSVPLTRALRLSSEAPQAPQNLGASAGQMRIALSWQEAEDGSVTVARYNVYRKADTGPWSYIASTTLTSYADLNVTEGAAYLYRVTAVSDAETESAPIELSSPVAPERDSSAPQITGFALPDGTRLAGEIRIAPLTSDNVGVDHVDFFLVGDDGSEIRLGSSAKGSLTVNSAEYKKEGSLSFRAEAWDAAGNSAEATVTYIADNAAPGQPALTVTETELSVTLRWSLLSVPKDIAGYRIYEILPGDERRLIGETKASVFVIDTALEKSYCVTAVDDLGYESAESNAETCGPGLDVTAPAIYAFESGRTVRETAALSVSAEDNGTISSWRIDFRPMTTDEVTGAVIPAGETQVLDEGAWAELAGSGEAAKTY